MRTLTSRNIHWIELARTACIMLVVLGHSTDTFIFQGHEKFTPGLLLFSCFARFAVPFFFVISGFLLQLGFNRKPEPPRYWPFMRDKLNTILIPFFVWNAIYLVLSHFVMDWPLFSWTALFTLLTGFVHLFFIFVLFQYFAVHPLLYRYLRGRSLRPLLIVAALISLCFYAISEYALWIDKNTAPTFEWYYGKLFVGWAFFFYLGIYLGNNLKLVESLARRALPLGLLALAALFLYYLETALQVKTFGVYGRFYFLFTGLISQTASTIFALALVQRLEQRFTGMRAMGYLVSSGKDTFGIYLIHYLFVMLLVGAWFHFNLPRPLALKVPLVFILAWISSQGIVRLCRLPLPGLRLLNRLLFGGRG